MDGDTQSMATAKPSRTRRQPSAKSLTPAHRQHQRDQIAGDKTEKLEHAMYERTLRRTRLALTRQKAQANALKAAGVEVKKKPSGRKPPRR